MYRYIRAGSIRVADRRQSVAHFVTIICWATAVAAGLITLVDYSTAPCDAARWNACWPSGSQVGRDKTRPTLVMFLHPRCPCSRASLNELARLQSECGGSFAIRIVFFRPENETGEWARTSLWWDAERIGGASPLIDAGGREARRFGVRTSGQTLVFASDGQTLFSGGITGGRSHEGQNEGAQAARRLLTGQSAVPVVFPVFGCSISNVRIYDQRS